MSWSGGTTGLWQSAANWSTGTLPASSDVVCIPTGTTVEISAGFNSAGTVLASTAGLTLSGGSLSVSGASPSTVGSLSITGGTLNGAGELDVTGSLGWSGGAQSGTGSTVLGSGATGTINPPGSSGAVNLDTRSLVNEGSLTVSSGTVRGYNGALLRNKALLKLNSEANYWGPTLMSYSGAASQLVNTSTGTIQKTAGAGATTLGFAVDNQGALDAQSGQFTFSGGGGPSTTGSWSASGTGSSLEFAGGAFSMGAGAPWAGAIKVSAGTVSVPSFQSSSVDLTLAGSGSLSLTSASTPSQIRSLSITGGTLTGAGELDVNNSLSWTSGSMNGSGSTVLGASATGTINAPGTSGAVNLDTRTLRNDGTLTLTAGNVRGYNAATIRNTGTFNVNSEASYWGQTITSYSGAASKLINTGTVKKASGTGITDFNVIVDNQSTIDAQTGALRFPTSQLTSSDGTTLKGSIRLTGAPVTLTGTQAQNADIQLSGGSLSVSGASPSTVGSLSITGGTLNGAGELDVTGSLGWSGGAQSGTGSTVLGSGATGTINPPGSSGAVNLDTRTLFNKGVVNLSSGSVRGYNAAKIKNEGRFKLNSEANYWGPTLSSYSGTPSTFVNLPGATFEKPSGSGTGALGFAVDNQGSFETQGGGKLEITSPLNQPMPCAGGTWTASPDGSRIAFTSGPICLASGAALSGSIGVTGANVSAPSIAASQASLSLTSGSLTLTDAGNASVVRDLDISGGTLSGGGTLNISGVFGWSSGSMTGAGSTVLGASSTGTINAPGTSGAVNLDTRTLRNDGTLTLTAGNVRGYNAATIRNTGTFNVNSEASYWGPTLASYSGSASRLVNSGTLKKASGTGTSGIGLAIDNQGAVSVPAGQLTFSGGGIPPEGAGPFPGDPLVCPTPTNPQHGTWVTASSGSAAINISAGCQTLDGGTVSGTLNVSGGKLLVGTIDAASAVVYASSGTLDFVDRAGNSTIGTLYLSGTLTGPGEVDVCGSFTWQAGTMSGTGATVICPGGSAQWSPPSGSLNMSRAFVNGGTAAWSSGAVNLSSGAAIYNDGVFKANSEYGMTGSSSSRIHNVGQIKKEAGTGTTSIGVPIDNPGSIIRTSGTLTVRSNSCQSNSESGEAEDEGNTSPDPTPSDMPPDFDDPTQSPGEGWEWRGKPPDGGDKGSWYNPGTDESWHPDLGHGEQIGPHWDYGNGTSGEGWRWGPDGEFTPKKSACA